MRKALIVNGEIVKYSDNTAAEAKPEITENRWADVIESEKPVYDDKSHSIKRIVDIGQDVTISWEKVPISSSVIEERRISGIKQYAEGKILKIMSETKQRNRLARMFQLAIKGPLTDAESAEAKDMNDKWNHARALRKYSNQMEADVSKPYAENGNWPTLN
jgi:hypothetical protein